MWHGMVWFGMVWCGLVCAIMVWLLCCGFGWFGGLVWLVGLLCFGVVWDGLLAWFGWNGDAVGWCGMEFPIGPY